MAMVSLIDRSHSDSIKFVLGNRHALLRGDRKSLPAYPGEFPLQFNRRRTLMAVFKTLVGSWAFMMNAG
jgi:hypothetical protein